MLFFFVISIREMMIYLGKSFFVFTIFEGLQNKRAPFLFNVEIIKC